MRLGARIAHEILSPNFLCKRRSFAPPNLSQSLKFGVSFYQSLPAGATESDRQLYVIARALAAGDLDAIRLIVHGLKSTTGSFGLMLLSARAAAVDRACREGQRAAALSLAGTLEGIARKSLVALAGRYPECSREVA